MGIDIERLKVDRAYWNSILPDWVQYIAQWVDGEWLGYEIEPEAGSVGYVDPRINPKIHYLCEWGEPNVNCRETLIKRPEPKTKWGGIDIDRLQHDLDYWISVAPEGATHYVIGSTYPWERKVGDEWYYFNADDENEWTCLNSKGDSRVSESQDILPMFPRPKQAIKPCQLSDDHPIRRINELGNQAHNLGCALQNDEEFVEDLDLIAGKLWDLGGRYRGKLERERERNELAKVIDNAYVRSEKWQTSYLDIADAILAEGYKKP